MHLKKHGELLLLVCLSHLEVKANSPPPPPPSPTEVKEDWGLTKPFLCFCRVTILRKMCLIACDVFYKMR